MLLKIMNEFSTATSEQLRIYIFLRFGRSAIDAPILALPHAATCVILKCGDDNVR